MARGATVAVHPRYHEGSMSTETDRTLRAILADVLGLKPHRVAAFDAETGLFGHLPELDSMSVAGLLTEMEDRLGFIIDDDEIDGEMLETYGSLLAFAEGKRRSSHQHK